MNRKLDDEAKKEALIKALYDYKTQILDRIMKEQAFMNEDSVDEKSQKLFNDLMTKQNE